MDVIEQSYLDALLRQTADNQAAIVRARQYHSGPHPVTLSPRVRQFMGTAQVQLNLTRAVVNAVAERLHIAHFESNDARLLAWIEATWQANQMAGRQREVHEMALRDGEAFLVADWQASTQQVRLIPHPHYTSTAVGGDGFGCYWLPDPADPNGEPLAAVKQWTETVREGGRLISRQRRTVYFADRIERYAHDGQGWQVWQPAGEPWPQPWVDATGAPLGLPVIGFRNPQVRPEATDALPVQDALNKLLVDLLATADLSAFQVLVALGWLPTNDGREPKADGSNWLRLEPGQIIGTTRTKTDADLKAIAPSSLEPLLALSQQLVLWLALVTDTPVHRFSTSRQVASEATLRQQEEPLLAKVRDRQGLFGPAWVQAVLFGARVANAFGRAGLPSGAGVQVRWAEMAARRDRLQLEQWRLMRELGAPAEGLLREMG